MVKAWEVVSLSATPPTLWVAAAVVFCFTKLAFDAISTPATGRSAYLWLALGVWVHFVGGFIDNAYWGIAWSHHFAGTEHVEWWFTHGAVSNVPFRQFTGIYAGYCHIKSTDVHYNQESNILRTVILTGILGALYVWSLDKFL